MGASAYAVLGVSRTATTLEIRAAYRALAKLHHPDVAGPGAETQFLTLRAAYELLADPERRRRYDVSPDDGIPDSDLVAIARRRRNERRRMRLMRLY